MTAIAAAVQEAISAGVFASTGGLENQRASILATDGTVTDGPSVAIGGFCALPISARVVRLPARLVRELVALAAGSMSHWPTAGLSVPAGC